MNHTISRNYSVSDVLKHIGMQATVRGSAENQHFTGVASISEASFDSLVFIAKDRKDKEALLSKTAAQIVVGDDELLEFGTSKCLVIVSEPKLAFARVVKALFVPHFESAIHPSAVIHRDAKIEEGVSVGPLTYVGVCELGSGSVIGSCCVIHDGTRIGRNVSVQAGTVIGAAGFGYLKNESGAWEHFPHIGGVVIEDNVEIGANTCIDRGALGDTIVRRGTRIDNLVHVAHNVAIGENSLVIAHAMIGGSTQVGNDCWIAPHTALRDGLKVGDRALVGMGAVVTKDIPTGETWIGSPAREIKDFLHAQQALRSGQTK